MAEWARLDVNFFRHPQVSRLKVPEQMRYLAMILYAQEHETDGHVEDCCLKWCDTTGRQAEAMEAAGLLDRTADGWQIVGFLNHQKSRDEMQAEREAARDRAKAAREKRREVRRA
jgi:hypothetical protein